MSALVHSELLKVRTTRGWWAYLIVIVLLVGIAVAADIGDASSLIRGFPEYQLGLVDSAGFAALLSIVLGITVFTTEFRHGTITPTLLAAPQREQVVAAKAIAATIVAVLFALLALAIVAAVTFVWLTVIEVDVHFADAEIGKRAAQMILLSVLWALMGVAIGGVVQSQVAALVGTLIWIFLGETLLLGLFGVLDLDGMRAYLPFQALDGADGTGGENLLSYGPAVAVSFGWIALLGAAGVARTRRRDIS